MIYFKACPRCRGDLEEQHDASGLYPTCIQCGYVKYEEPLRKAV
jgi:reverse gyrase